MEEEQPTGKNFFSTLPGIITAIAGLITAIGGLILILNKTGCISPKAANTNQHTISTDAGEVNSPQDSTSNKGSVSYSPNSIRHITRYLVYKIEEANVAILPNGEIVLSLKIKCRNDSKYEYHFYSNNIRPRVNGESYAADPYSPSGDYQAVPGNSFKNLEYNFKLPAGTKSFSLVFYDENNEIGFFGFTLK